jgi:hypothetical protein
MDNLLHRLGVEGEPAFGRLFQFALPRPPGMGHPRILVQLHAEVPHLCRFPLRRFEATQERWREMGQAIDANYFHTHLFFFSAPNAVIGRREKGEGGRFHPVP